MLIDGLSGHKNSNVQTAIRAVELILLSAGIVSTILMIKGAVESSCSYDMVLSTLRKPWFYFRSWLSSPFYICIIINLIVILIAASSVFHQHKIDNNGHDAIRVGSTEDDGFESSLTISLSSPPPPPPAPPPSILQNSHKEHYEDAQFQNCNFNIKSLTKAEEIRKAKSFDEPRKEEAEKTKNSEGDDTMEATWRAITGEGAKPQNKQLKKTETWPQPPEVFPCQENNEESDKLKKSSARKELKKSMTFNETVSIRCRGGLMRDPSMSLEEFNGRVEDFIKKFNNDMRLQRQESEQRYLEMINRSI